ncbi:MAG: ACP S-malonyltransferase [Gammaproteobacteria bacterium]
MTKKIALVFPGQGSQSIGMLAGFADVAVVKQAFAEASQALGEDLWQLAQQGPEEKLNDTRWTQPALLAAGVAVQRAWQAAGGAAPVVMAGHSLGEYSALVAAGALSLADGVKLVAERGRLMQEAVPPGAGGMAAILGLEDDAVRAACAQAAQGEVVSAVNLNAPGQVVIAGSKAAVERAIEACKAAGAKRAIALPVSVPSHCALMKPAAEKLAVRLQEISISVPAIPVLNNVDVVAAASADAIRDALVRQLYSPVRWVETATKLANDGVNVIVECGPGKVLSGLNKRIAKDAECLCVQDPASLEAALAAANGG